MRETQYLVGLAGLVVAAVSLLVTTTGYAQDSAGENVQSAPAKSMPEQIGLLHKQIDDLKIYRDHMQATLQDQQAQTESLERQLAGVQKTQSEIVPLMYRMVDELASWIERDRPVQTQLRLDRVADLRELLARADVSNAEKYRSILEVYQTEIAYGSKLGTYRTQLNVEGEPLEVDVLYMGRVSLCARSLDHTRYWAWNANASAWQVMDNMPVADIDDAFTIAAEQTFPRVVTLPISVSATDSQSAQALPLDSGYTLTSAAEGL